MQPACTLDDIQLLGCFTAARLTFGLAQPDTLMSEAGLCVLNTRTMKDNREQLRLGHNVLTSQLLLHTYERITGSMRPDTAACCSTKP